MNTNQTIRAYTEFTTNIKGLPEGEYLTETLYSDTSAWKVIGRTATTLTLQEVEVAQDPEWTPNIIPGGFAGHCTNQNEQTWLYAGLSPNTCTVRLVKSKYHGSDKLWGSKGRTFIANGARRKYDYNF
jgi:hypothetical protein